MISQQCSEDRELPDLVSIVIPCFNGEKFVGAAIESALAQTHPHKEVIVIDDGSTDGSTDVLRSFGDAIRWETGPNRGGCAARNRGIELARGAWIQLLDADDLLNPDKLARQMPAAERELGRGGIVFCDHLTYGEDEGTEPVRATLDFEEDDPLILVLKHSALQTSAPLHRREWLRGVGGFRAGLPAAQEFDLHLRLAAAGRRFVHLPQVLFRVRRRAASVSSDTGRTFAMHLRFLPELIAGLESRGALTPRRRAELAGYAARRGRHCVRYGQPEAGMELLELADSLDRPAATAAAYGPLARLGRRLLGRNGVEQLARWRRLARSLTSMKSI